MILTRIWPINALVQSQKEELCGEDSSETNLKRNN